MENLKIIIGASKDHFGAYAENFEGIYGAGDTPALAIENVLQAIEIVKRTNHAEILNSEVEFKYDAESFLKYYSKIFSKPALEKITGINQKQLHHYASGIKKPREAQRRKIENALHNLGKELLAVRL